MTKSLLVSGGPTTQSFANGDFSAIIGNPLQHAGESSAQLTVRVAGTFSKFGEYFVARGTSTVVRFRKNGANGNAVLTPAANGFTFDDVNTDAVVSGDTVDAGCVSAGSPTVAFFRTVFEASVNHVAFMGCARGSPVVSGTHYLPLGGEIPSNLTTEARTQFKVRAPGTFSKLYVLVTANASGTSSAITLRKNGAAGNLTVTIGIGATGIFEDTTHTDTVVDGDLVSIEVAGNNAALTIEIAAVTFTNTETPARNDLVSYVNGSILPAATRYLSIAGDVAIVTSEASAKIRHGFFGQCSKLRYHAASNTLNGDVTIVLRKNGVDANQTITIPAGAADGWFEDTTHTDDFAPTDDFSVRVTSAGSSGSVRLDIGALTETALIVAGVSDALASADVTSGFLHPPLSGVVADSLMISETFSGTTRSPINAGVTDALATSDSRSASGTYHLSVTDTPLALSDQHTGTRIFSGQASVTDNLATVDIRSGVLHPAITASRADTVVLTTVHSATVRAAVPTWQAIGERRESLFPN